MRPLLTVSWPLLLTLAVTRVEAQTACAVQVQTISAQEVHVSGAIDLEGSQAVITTTRAISPTESVVELRTYSRTAQGWVEEQAFAHDDPEQGDGFGLTLALDGDVLAVGAPQKDNPVRFEDGAVYIFRKIGGLWQQTQRIIVPLAAPNGGFARALDLEDGTLVVSGGEGFGVLARAYVFTDTSGTFELSQELQAGAQQFDSNFSEGLDLDGDRLAIGADANDTDGVLNSGAVWIFERTGGVWSEDGMIQLPTPTASGRFGKEIALDEDRMAVATAPTSTGSVSVFRRVGGNWQLEQQMFPPQAGPFSLPLYPELDGNHLLVGHPFDPTFGNAAGSARLYVRSAGIWVEQRPLVSADIAANSLEGAAVALDGSAVFVAAPGAGTMPFGPPAYGVTYAYELGSRPGLYGEAHPGAHGAPPEIEAASCLHAARIGMLTVSSGPAGALGVLLVGDRASTPTVAGTLLVDPLVPLLWHRLDENGFALVRLDPGLLPAGARLHLQALYLDPSTPHGVAMTRGLTLELP